MHRNHALLQLRHLNLHIYPNQSPVPASTATRARIAFGRTASLYSADCCSNKSTQGILTTRTSIFSFANSALASKAKDTSEPVAMMIASGVSFVESAITIAAFNASLELPGSCGKF